MKTLMTVLLLAQMGGLAAGQSLWNPRRPFPGMFADITARNVGDVLTIVVNEQQQITNQEKSNFTREETIDSKIEDFAIFPNAFNPLPSVKGSSSKDLQGSGKYDKRGSFETRFSVIVIDVLPNGNMIVEGRRKVIIDKETKTMRLTGIVRPYDVTINNTVLSEQIANASISYQGEGPLTRATNRGWLGELLDMVWPF